MNYAPRKIRLIMELRAQGITDTRVLSAIERVPREEFVPAELADQSYENTALPIGLGQTISQPLIVGMMTQALDLGERMIVLEIGTGCGYQTAVLAQLCRRVYTIERHRPLIKEAEERLDRLGYRNVVTRVGDGFKGWPEVAPFDRIIVTAAAPELPRTLIDQLSDGGIMVLPIGANPIDQWLVKVARLPEGIVQERLAPVRFVPMVSGLPPEGEREPRS
ncbi:MAG: protein-L-isoaspartate(D-aspartate) O-methyltransferase [Alphaproteobacteria bacterium]|nr:protein-L-isoaspartate(D-aspartate) O-methyltransferase [Alphaproteobacteria bacterium]